MSHAPRPWRTPSRTVGTNASAIDPAGTVSRCPFEHEAGVRRPPGMRATMFARPSLDGHALDANPPALEPLDEEGCDLRFHARHIGMTRNGDELLREAQQLIVSGKRRPS